MRLIDADRLKEMFKKRYSDFEDVLEMLLGDVDEQPTVEAVKHGDWILKHIGAGHYWECSVCHTNPCIYVTKDTKYCPNCGAMMDGDKNDTD